MSKPLEQLRKILEYLWLVVSIIAIGIGVRELIIHNINPALPFFIFALIGIFFFSSRRNQRKNK